MTNNLYTKKQNLILFWGCRLLNLSTDWLIDLVGRVFANGPGDLGSIPGRVLPKTLKMVLDTSLLNTQQYKVHIKGKVEQSRERSSALPYALNYSRQLSMLFFVSYLNKCTLQLYSGL